MRLSDEMEPIIEAVRERREQIGFDVSELHLPSFNAGWRSAMDWLAEALEDRDASSSPTPAAADAAPCPVPPTGPASDGAPAGHHLPQV